MSNSKGFRPTLGENKPKYLVRTPYGLFSNFSVAGKTLGMFYSTVQNWCKDVRKSEWEKIETPEEIQLIPTGLVDKLTDTPDHNYWRPYTKAISTPYGVFSSMAECSRVLNIHYETVRNRLSSKHQPEWVVVTSEALEGVLELAEDEWDDILFKEGCWLDKVERVLEPERAIIHYLYKGKEYTCSSVDWVNGHCPHLNLGETINE